MRDSCPTCSGRAASFCPSPRGWKRTTIMHVMVVSVCYGFDMNEHTTPGIGDKVTIHTGTNVYEVTDLGDDMAKVWPVDENDTRDGFWIGVDQLHPAPSHLDVTSESGRLCWAGFVTGQPYVEVMVRNVGRPVDPYVVFLDGQPTSAHATPVAAMDASKAAGYVNHGTDLESSMGG